MDADLALVRAFVTVARTLHFGRAAAELYVAQPALSRQIRRLERELGVPLFDRTSRSVLLTAAGQAFLPDAERLLADADAAVRRLRTQLRGPQLVLGFMTGIDAAAVAGELGRHRPNLAVELVSLQPHTQIPALRDGTVDAALARTPLADEDIIVHPLYTEPRVVLLPATHRLAGKEAVSIIDVADDPIVRHLDHLTAWGAAWAVDPRPDGRRPRYGPIVRGLEEKLEHVATGQAIAILPLSAAQAHTRPGITHALLTDVPPAQAVLAHHRSLPEHTVTTLIAAAQTVAPPNPSPPATSRQLRQQR